MEISLGKLPFDLDFHPSNPLVAAGLITGDLLLYRYAADSPPQRLLEVHAHSESCRALRFINEGRAIVTGSPDCSILSTDVETGSAIARLESSHGAAVNRIISLTESTIASGDDEGCIKVWDTRQRTCCNSFDVHEEYISDMTLASDSIRLLGTSGVGDGTLSVCNLRSNKVQTRSEFSEDELLSVLIMKTMVEKLYVGRKLELFYYIHGVFSRTAGDRFVDLSPNSIDAFLMKIELLLDLRMGSLGENILWRDKPGRHITQQNNTANCGAFRISYRASCTFSHDKKFLGSISHDHTLKLWDMDDLLQGSGNTVKSHSAVADSDSDEADEMDMDDTLPKSSQGRYGLLGPRETIQIKIKDSAVLTTFLQIWIKSLALLFYNFGNLMMIGPDEIDMHGNVYRFS
ncbi:unnamed protein product [Camellia sinensis]